MAGRLQLDPRRDRQYKHEVTRCSQTAPRRPTASSSTRPCEIVPLPAHRGPAGARGDLDLSAPASDLAHQPVLQAGRYSTCARACSRSRPGNAPPGSAPSSTRPRRPIPPSTTASAATPTRPGVLRPAAAVRVRRPAEHDLDHAAGLHPAGRRIDVDRRLTAAVAVPARPPGAVSARGMLAEPAGRGQLLEAGGLKFVVAARCRGAEGFEPDKLIARPASRAV